ncbi:MAG: hypothetical protein U9N81_03765 [Bacillota bacterium]|nr:hypothetical protein [Bacillota bacterium]
MFFLKRVSRPVPETHQKGLLQEERPGVTGVTKAGDDFNADYRWLLLMNAVLIFTKKQRSSANISVNQRFQLVFSN